MHAFLKKFNLMCLIGFAYMYVCALLVCSVHRGQKGYTLKLDWSWRCLGNTMWVLANQPASSGRIASALNIGLIYIAPVICLWQCEYRPLQIM